MRWLVLDWRQTNMDLMALFDFEAEKLIFGLDAYFGTVVKYTPKAESELQANGLITYCSNLIARLLGVGNHLILTPYQLYRTLLKAGGEEVHSWRSQNVETQQANPGTGTARSKPIRARTRTPS
jgi:hypothetical protein